MKLVPAFLVLFGAVAPILCAEDAPKPLDPVHFSKIIPLLPAPPEGWKAPDPDGSTSDMGGFKMTTAGRTYTKGEGDDAPTVSVNIIDYANNKQFYDATTTSWSFSQDSTDGYMKSVKIGDYPGFETFDKSNNSGSLWLIVAQRFFVHIDITNLAPEEMRKWMQTVDLKKLATLK